MSILLRLAVVVALVCAGPAADARTVAQKPNVVVIVADDLGYADIAAYHPGRGIPTPNIDRLAREGVRFTAGYATASVCSPSRAALMTGRYQQRYGFEYLTLPMSRGPNTTGLDPSEQTLATTLKTVGYRTGMIGKWHLGFAEAFWPVRRVFDEFFGFLGGELAHIDATRPGVHSASIPFLGERSFRRTGAAHMARMKAGDETPTRVDDDDRYMPEEISREATRFIRENRRRPFFLYVGHHVPHSPFQVTDTYWNRFPNIADRRQRIYAGMVSALDDGVGEIMEALRAEGLEGRTLVVFTSDNGCATYVAHGVCDSTVLSGGKLGQLEGGYRVPYIMRWPAALPAGRVEDRAVSTLDIYATAVAAAGARQPADKPLDGVDLRPLMAPGATSQPIHRAVHMRIKPFATVRMGDWKLIRDNRFAEIGKEATGERKTQSLLMLFNLKDDPKEVRDLSHDLPERTQALLEAMNAFEAQAKEPAWPGADNRYFFDGRVIESRN